MARLHLVRHGRAAAGWGDAADPGLDDHGVAQATTVARELAVELAPRRVVTSPMRRALETAQPLAATWGVDPETVAAFGEIPSPAGGLSARAEWLDGALRSNWSDLGDEVGAWRSSLLEAVRATTSDVVVFTHFVAINAVVSAIRGTDAVTTFLPANTSVTVVDVDLGVDVDPTKPAGLLLVRLGHQARANAG